MRLHLWSPSGWVLGITWFFFSACPTTGERPTSGWVIDQGKVFTPGQHTEIRTKPCKEKAPTNGLGLVGFFGLLEWTACAPLSEESRRGSLRYRQETQHQTPDIGFHIPYCIFHADFLFSHGFKGSSLLTFIRQPKTTDKSYSEASRLCHSLAVKFFFFGTSGLTIGIDELWRKVPHFLFWQGGGRWNC